MFHHFKSLNQQIENVLHPSFEEKKAFRKIIQISFERKILEGNQQRFF